MITLVLASLLVTQPLMATGNEVGVWFVRDTQPGSLGPAHELCQQVDRETYTVVLPLANRPIALGMHEQTLWFVGNGDRPVLYRVRLIENQATGDLRAASGDRAVAVKILQVTGTIRDLVFLNGKPALVVENDGLQCFDIDGNALTPFLSGVGGHIAILNRSLIAVIPTTNQLVKGVQFWRLVDTQWVQGAFVPSNDELCEIVIRDDWLLLVLSNGGKTILVNLQEDLLVEMASFPSLAGRWSIVSNRTTGLTAIGSQRNGTTTMIDIGWPSCEISEPILLHEKSGNYKLTEMIIMIASTVVFFILMTTFIRGKPKKSNKMDSSNPRSSR